MYLIRGSLVVQIHPIDDSTCLIKHKRRKDGAVRDLKFYIIVPDWIKLHQVLCTSTYKSQLRGTYFNLVVIVHVENDAMRWKVALDCTRLNKSWERKT